MKARQNGSHYYLYLNELERIRLGRNPCISEIVNETTGLSLNRKIELSHVLGMEDSEVITGDLTKIRLGFQDYEDIAKQPPARTIIRDGNLSYQIDVVTDLRDVF